jgi:hypothetical protein
MRVLPGLEIFSEQFWFCTQNFAWLCIAILWQCEGRDWWPTESEATSLCATSKFTCLSYCFTLRSWDSYILLLVTRFCALAFYHTLHWFTLCCKKYIRYKDRREFNNSRKGNTRRRKNKIKEAKKGVDREGTQAGNEEKGKKRSGNIKINWRTSLK